MNQPTIDDALDVMVDRLRKAFDPDRIILFGSHADGRSRSDSDVDLLIIVPEAAEPPHRRAQRAYRCVGAVGVAKDLVVLTRAEFEQQAEVAGTLARQAQATGKVLYEREEAGRGSGVVGQEPA